MSVDAILMLARRARENAYAPCSRFRVGACLRAASGAGRDGIRVTTTTGVRLPLAFGPEALPRPDRGGDADS